MTLLESFRTTGSTLYLLAFFFRNMHSMTPPPCLRLCEQATMEMVKNGNAEGGVKRSDFENEAFAHLHGIVRVRCNGDEMDL
jgi:hypothetical protein